MQVQFINQKQMEESRLKNQGAITSLKQILKDMK
jgi:hypothetical protein